MFALTLTADLTGVTDLAPVDTPENPYFFSFKVQCTSCREIHVNWINFCRFDSSAMAGSRGDASFVWKCRMCKRESSASIKTVPAAYVHASPPTKQKILEFDCRGLEFVDFKPDGEWKAKGLDSTTVFAGIDLGDDEWYEYDEKVEAEVTIKDMRWEVVRA